MLQLPPVNKQPRFVKLFKTRLQKYVGSVGVHNLWSKFTYDELTINMRQNEDTTNRDILSKIRIGLTTDKDIAILKKRQIKLEGSSHKDRLQSLCNYIEGLSTDAVCLLPRREQCDALNSAMLSRMQSEEIKLIAKDSTADCSPYVRKKALHLLEKYENETS